MFNLQGSEIIVILLLALVILGPEKLPDAIRRFSQTYAELKKMGTGFQSELRSALDEPVRELRETAELVRDAADPEKLAEQAKAEAAVDAVAADIPIDERAYTITDPAAETRAAAEGAGGNDSGATGATSDDTVAAEPAGPVNRIAAANSSAALAAVSADAADAADGDTAEAGADTPDRPPGPAFHSAAPKRPVDATSAGSNGHNQRAAERAPADAAAAAGEPDAVDATEEAATP